MKKVFFIVGFVFAGLFLEVGTSFADSWESTGPTAEDMQAAIKVDNLAVKGSLEDKLINAVKNGDLKDVETFIAKGAGLEARDNENMTALMTAAEKGYFEIARILMDAGADMNAQDKFGCTAFFKAADKNHVEVVKMLVAKGAFADSTFEDILVSSVFKGNTEMVKALIVESSRIKSDTLNTAYMMALNNRRRNPELFDAIAQAYNK